MQDRAGVAMIDQPQVGLRVGEVGRRVRNFGAGLVVDRLRGLGVDDRGRLADAVEVGMEAELEFAEPLDVRGDQERPLEQRVRDQQLVVVVGEPALHLRRRSLRRGPRQVARPAVLLQRRPLGRLARDGEEHRNSAAHVLAQIDERRLVEIEHFLRPEAQSGADGATAGRDVRGRVAVAQVDHLGSSISGFSLRRR
jgi:hypothetical protein